jgi:hypothetical protein
LEKSAKLFDHRQVIDDELVYLSTLIMRVLKCPPVLGCFMSSNALIMGRALILGMPIPPHLEKFL